MEKVGDKLEDGEKEQMEDFVRGLLKTMPLSSLTQRIVREKYRAQYKKEKPLSGKQSEMLRNVVVEVARAELNKEGSNSTKSKEQQVQDPTVSGSDQVAQKRPAEENKPENEAKKAKSDMKSIVVEEDEDCIVVSVNKADILPHCRADCPLEIYTPTENVKIGPYSGNEKHCEKCFCYICDKKSSDCANWSLSREPHCNANSRAACWKARRMVQIQVKFAFLNRCVSKHVTQQRQAAIRGEATIICVEMREVYQQYRMGAKCDAKLVPCNCSCHRQKTPNNWCGKCRSVHDLKKKFDYRPIRAKVQELIRRIQQWTKSAVEQLFLLEVICSELCLHKGADINQMTQVSGNPDKDAQCNNHEMLKADYVMGALSQCLAQNNQLWKDFNEAVRLVFRAQAFPDHFIKQYFESLQTAINRERGQRSMRPQPPRTQQQPGINMTQPQVMPRHQTYPGQPGGFPVQGQFSDQGQRILQPQMMVNGQQGRPPGARPQMDPFQRRTPQGNGAREVRSISPAVSTPPTTPSTPGQPHPGPAPARRTTVAVAHVSPSAAAGNATGNPAGPPRTLQYGPAATLVASTGPLSTITHHVKLLSPEQEDALIQKCEDNIKRGQFNSTIKEIKPIVISYRTRNQKFHRKDTIVTYLVCLAHTNPIETLKELWNMHKVRQGATPVSLTGEDLARILCITIQDVPSIKKVVITRRYNTPPEWPIVGPTAQFKKNEELMRAVFVVLIGLIKTQSNQLIYGNVDVLVFALRIFCPMWNHQDGNDLRDMLKYYNQTKEINRELEPDKINNLTFDAIMRHARMRERVGNGTTRVFCIAFLLAKHVTKWESRHPDDIINLLAHPRAKYSDVTANTSVASNIWNFALFALCNQQPVATRMIELKKYSLLEWYLKFLSNAENGVRFNTVSNYLNIEVVKVLCKKGSLNFAVKMFESLFGTISEFLICGKLNHDSKRKYYDKYIEIGCQLAERIRDSLKTEGCLKTEKSGGNMLHQVPEWFTKIDFLNSLTFGAAEIQRNKLDILHLFCLYKKTSIERKYAENQPVDISLQLFNDPKSYPDSKMKCKVQSRILTSFINGLKDQQLSEAELFLHELMSQGSPYPRDDITFLKCLRLVMAMSKRRHNRQLPFSIEPANFKKTEFQHHCNPNYDPSFNLVLFIRTICDGDDDAMEYIHIDHYRLVVEVISDATFAWLDCQTCLTESTKMVEERVKAGAGGFNIMLAKLVRRKRNVTGFLKIFFGHFWTYSEGLADQNLSATQETTPEYDTLTNSYDIVGKILMALSTYSDFFSHIVTKFRSSSINHLFKANCLKFMGCPLKREITPSGLNEEKPNFKYKTLSEIFKSGSSELPPLPRLKRKPQSPRGDDVTMDKLFDNVPPSSGPNPNRQKYSPDSTTKDPLDTNPSDDDYNPFADDGNVFLNGDTPTRKRTRYESDRIRQEELEKRTAEVKLHQEEIRKTRSDLSRSFMMKLRKAGYALPVAFETESLETCSFDAATWRIETKPLTPKLTLKFSVDS